MVLYGENGLAFSDDLGNEWKSSVGFAREKLCWSILFGTRGKISDFRGRSPRYGCGGYFIQTRNRRSSENGHSGLAWLQSVFSDDLGNEWKSSVGFAREKYSGLKLQ